MDTEELDAEVKVSAKGSETENSKKLIGRLGMSEVGILGLEMSNNGLVLWE